VISDDLAVQLRAVFQAQHHLLGRLTGEVAAIREALEGVDHQTTRIGELERMVVAIETRAEFLRSEDLDDLGVDDVRRLYEARRESVSRELVTLQYQDWSSFVRQCESYSLAHGLDPLLPYEAFLTDADLQQLDEESYEGQYRWDRWDYLFVGTAGVLAALTDLLLVKIPKTMKTGEYKGQKGSPLTEWLKSYNTSADAKEFQDDWFARWARKLEKACKVPYDSCYVEVDGTLQWIKGMGSWTHRFQSLGHDPVLGFVFGVLDIMRGTITGFSFDSLGSKFVSGRVWSNLEPVGLIEALLTQFGHLVSDVATPTGLPAPFMTAMQALKLGSFGEKGRTVAEVSRWMYTQGYDFRHFLVGGIGPGVIEIVLRAYILLRHYFHNGEVNLTPGGHPKYRSMLLAAHGVAAAANAGKVALYQGNPLAINMAQWMALFRYLVPSIKYWAFDRHRLKMQHLEAINDNGWGDLEAATAETLELVAGHEFPLLELGTREAPA